MKIRTWLTLLLLPLFVASSAHAIFGIPDVAAMAQRVTIIANQGAQIANQIAQLATLNGQLGKLTEQFEHIKDSTLGQVGAITQPFTDLASIPGQLIGTGMSWKSDFTGHGRRASKFGRADERRHIHHPGHANPPTDCRHHNGDRHPDGLR